MANSNTADMSSVRAILESMKTTLPPGAEKIMEDVERQQQVRKID